jgi:chorismate mutase
LIYCRGIRGATTVTENTRAEILSATTELLQLIIRQNDLKSEDIVSAIFSLTEDLDAEFPALAARTLGWTEVPLLCAREIPVPGSLGKCIRVLLHVNTTRSQAEMRHVYIRGAVNLRPTKEGKHDDGVIERPGGREAGDVGPACCPPF